jgi:opacity protein-like surface antigen
LVLQQGPLVLSPSSTTKEKNIMMKQVFGTLVAFLAVSATPVMAQEGPFSGFYGGVEIGAARPNTKTTVTPVTGPAVSRTNKSTSVDYGAFGGYGYTFESGLYLAGELGVNRTGGKAKIVSLGGVNVRERSSYDLSLTGRAGYVLGDSTLVYGLAGASQRQANYLLPGGTRRNATVTGRTFGLGVAQAFGDNLFGRIELERTDYGKKTYVTTGTPVLPGVRYEPEATRLSAGLGYSF